MTRHELLNALRATPDRLMELARDLSQGQLRRRPKEGEWSMHEIANHLLIGEREVILPRLRRMRSEDSPVFASSASGGARSAGALDEQGCPDKLHGFRQVRATLELLESLSDREWQRTGTTPTRGTLTIEAYANYLAEHDREHLEQLDGTRALVTGK